MKRSQLCGAVMVMVALVAAERARAQGQLQSVLVASGFSQPLYATAPDGDTRVFVVERAGRVMVVKNGVVQSTPFLDIQSRVGVAGEGGLLGLAFPPDYASTGFFTVYYTDANIDSVVARFRVTSNPDVADPNSGQTLLFIDQPDGMGFQNHKGGTVEYGADGFLWFATGDGGGTNDPAENAQNPQSLLGKMLRIDVGPSYASDSIPVNGQIYRIPADNPFVGKPPRDEIWALGLRGRRLRARHRSRRPQLRLGRDGGLDLQHRRSGAGASVQRPVAHLARVPVRTWRGRVLDHRRLRLPRRLLRADRPLFLR